MPASLTEEELARLEALSARVPEFRLDAGESADLATGVVECVGTSARIVKLTKDVAELIVAARSSLPALLASARAVRNVDEVLSDLKRVATLHAQAGDGVTSGALLAAVVSIRGALTATAEPTAGEER